MYTKLWARIQMSVETIFTICRACLAYVSMVPLEEPPASVKFVIIPLIITLLNQIKWNSRPCLFRITYCTHRKLVNYEKKRKKKMGSYWDLSSSSMPRSNYTVFIFSKIANNLDDETYIDERNTDRIPSGSKNLWSLSTDVFERVHYAALVLFYEATSPLSYNKDVIPYVSIPQSQQEINL